MLLDKINRGGKLLRGAKIAVETCMGVKRGESVLVVTDPPRLKIAEALINAAKDANAEAILMCMQPRQRHGEEPPKTVAAAMREADVVLAPTTYSLTHTQARREACEAGARIATMPMITERMMCRGVMLADYKQVRKLTLKVARILDKASWVEITAPAGTSLTLSIEGRKAYSDTGIYHKPGEWGNLPAGETFIAPVEGTADGKIVVDGGLAGFSRDEFEIVTEKGRAMKISGAGADELIKKLNEVGGKAYWIAEFGLGTNPKASLAGNVLEAEKVLGTCHVALGDNSTFGGKIRAGIHLDGILRRPTIELDGKVVMRAGRFGIPNQMRPV